MLSLQCARTRPSLFSAADKVACSMLSGGVGGGGEAEICLAKSPRPPSHPSEALSEADVGVWAFTSTTLWNIRGGKGPYPIHHVVNVENASAILKQRHYCDSACILQYSMSPG